MSTIRSPIASLLTMVANSTVLSHHIRAMFCPVHREAVTPFHEKDIRNDTLRTTQSSLVRLAFSPLVCISFSCVKSRWRDEGFDTRYGTRVWSPPRSRSPGWPRYGGGVGSAGVPVASGNSRRPLLSRCEGLSLETLSATLDCSREWLRRPEVPGNVPGDPGPQERLGQPWARPLK